MCGNGHIIRGTPIAVDLWDIKICSQVHLFFLSHFHADHTSGLSSSWKNLIYTSVITKKLLVNIVGMKSSLIHSLEIGEDHLLALDCEEKEMVTVKLFNANHCPGAVMFLFSGYFGNIMYTGDFRYTPNILDFNLLPDIDILYLDNTYCSPKCIFPTKEDCCDVILHKIHTCLQESKRIFIGMDKLGKEELLIKICKETQKKIYVNSSKKIILDILCYSEIITTNKMHTNMFVVPTSHITGYNIQKWNSEMKTCAILATARFIGYNFRPFCNNENIHIFPYSNHSSYTELNEFVKKLRPRVVIPIVDKNVKGMFGIDISQRADMSVFKKFLNCTAHHDIIIPESVKRIMNLFPENGGNASESIRRKKNQNNSKKKLLISKSCGIEFFNEIDSSPLNGNSKEEHKFNVKADASPTYVWEIAHVSNNGHKVTYLHCS